MNERDKNREAEEAEALEPEATITREELAAKYPPLARPTTITTLEIIAFPVTAKRSIVSGVMYHRAHRKLRFWVKGTGLVQFSGVPVEYFVEHVSHGATVDEKIPLYFEGRFRKTVLPIESVDNWEL